VPLDLRREREGVEVKPLLQGCGHGKAAAISQLAILGVPVGVEHLNGIREDLLGILMQVGDGQSCCQSGEVGMLGRTVSRWAIQRQDE